MQHKQPEQASDKVRAFLYHHCTASGISPVPMLWDDYKRVTGDDSMPEWRFVGALWQLSQGAFAGMAVTEAVLKGPDWSYDGLVVLALQLNERARSAVARNKVRAFLEERCDMTPAVTGPRPWCPRLGELHEAFLQQSQGQLPVMHLPEFLQALWQLELEMPSLNLRCCLRPSLDGWEQLKDMQL